MHILYNISLPCSQTTSSSSEQLVCSTAATRPSRGLGPTGSGQEGRPVRRGLAACGRGTSRRTVGGEVLDDGRQGRDVAKGGEGRA